ncbi:hypothetical protein D3C77_715000 [compost metagenome]
MGEFFGANIVQQPDDFVWDRVPLIQITQCSGQFSIGTAVLLKQQSGHSNITFAYTYRVLQLFLINPHYFAFPPLTFSN